MLFGPQFLGGFVGVGALPWVATRTNAQQVWVVAAYGAFVADTWQKMYCYCKGLYKEKCCVFCQFFQVFHLKMQRVEN